jgi:hypothetical protein
MFFLNILLGIALIIFGIWLTVNRIKAFIKGVENTLGGSSGLLMVGITCIICGIIEICRQI